MVYAWLLVFTLSGPLLWSFERKIAYAKKWWALFPAILITAFYFLVWDHFFTQWGVWGFNERYLAGITLGLMPLEEYLFFVIVPFSCVFLYEVMKYYVSRDIFAPWARSLTGILTVLLFLITALNWGKLYTCVASLGAAIALTIQYFRNPWYMGRFYMGYLVSLIPFFLVNGILTGSFLAEPVVWYNNSENLGVRMGTIPVDDSIYLILLLLSVISIYQELLDRRKNGAPAPI